jgi:hypothetical protein
VTNSDSAVKVPSERASERLNVHWKEGPKKKKSMSAPERMRHTSAGPQPPSQPMNVTATKKTR